MGAAKMTGLCNLDAVWAVVTLDHGPGFSLGSGAQVSKEMSHG